MLAEAQVSGGLYSTIVQRRADAPRVGAAPTASEMETVPLKKLAALSGVKTEFIYDAVALVPKHLGTSAKSEVSILLHLHGLSNVGPNYEKMLGKEGLIPSEYDMAAQLQTFSAARPSAPLIALLPVGQTLPKRGTVDFGDFDTTTLVNETVTQLVGMNKLPAGSTAGSVILSAHSAGGFYARNAASQKTSAKQVAGMLAFESIHDADIGKYESFLKGKIEDDIKEVHRLGPPASTGSAKAEAAFREQSQYLREHGFRFVGFAGLVNYKSRFHRLRVAIFGEKGKKGWIDDQHELGVPRPPTTHRSANCSRPTIRSMSFRRRRRTTSKSSRESRAMGAWRKHWRPCPRQRARLSGNLESSTGRKPPTRRRPGPSRQPLQNSLLLPLWPSVVRAKRQRGRQVELFCTRKICKRPSPTGARMPS
jgi:hypothetical protein